MVEVVFVHQDSVVLSLMEALAIVASLDIVVLRVFAKLGRPTIWTLRVHQRVAQRLPKTVVHPSRPPTLGVWSIPVLLQQLIRVVLHQTMGVRIN